ncbi:MAG: periplasmic heavy metal sensor [Marinilabiliales bacterium]|nr:periplasmic heavy metal sensor [Marinilabiliales bacterium]
MKTKLLMLVALVLLGTGLYAQTNDPAPRKAFPMRKGAGFQQREHFGNALNLTEDQKKFFKESAIAMHKSVQPLVNELREAKAHMKTLITAAKPDQEAINKNIEKMGKIKTEIQKIRTNHLLEMRAQLNDEQKLKMDLFKAKKMMKERFKRRGPVQG